MNAMLTGIEGRMARKNEAELVLGADEILSHVSQILSKGTSGLAPLRTSFMEVAEGRRFSSPEFKTLIAHANKTGLTNIDNNATSLWHLFKDPLGKRAIVSDLEPVGDEICMDMIIYTRWAAHNFPMIMNVSLPKETPNLLCRASDVSEFSVFLAYMDQKIVPALERHLCHAQGIGPDALNAQVKAREKEILSENARGVDVIKPIPTSKWPVAHPSVPI
jgi:hypothetical protein